MTAPFPPEERVLRECGCPPWVIRCAHFNDEAVVLAGPPSEPAARVFHSPDCFLVAQLHKQELWIVGLDSQLVACPYCGAARAGFNRPFMVRFTDSYEDALSAFYEAEEALIRGEL